MSNFDGNSPQRFGSVPRTAGLDIDQGLRSYMLQVYNYMAIGLALTGIAAYAAFSAAVQGDQLTAFGQTIFVSPLKYVIMLAPLALVFGLSMGINRITASTARALFFVYSALVGLSLSVIFLVYTQQSITQVFFITAASFASLSLYGYTTKRDLTSFGSFLVMGLFGLIIASIVNIFMQSGPLGFVISAAGVLIFAGLTAYDTQKIKEMYFEADGSEMIGKKAVMGALSLYLDFINLFLSLLRLMGDRRN